MSRGGGDFYYSNNIICCKWYDKKPVLLLATNLDGMSGVSNKMRQTRGSPTNAPVSCPNIIKLYNYGMGGEDMDQKIAAYGLNCKSKYRKQAFIT